MDFSQGILHYESGPLKTLLYMYTLRHQFISWGYVFSEGPRAIFFSA